MSVFRDSLWPQSGRPLTLRQGVVLATTGVLLLASVAWSPTEALWRHLDWACYHAAQRLLQLSLPLATVFATLNLHPVGNLIMDAAFVAVGLPWLARAGCRQELASRLALVSYYVVAWRVTMSVVNRWFFGTILEWQSASPTLVESPLVNLQELLPGQNVKVFAVGTFPSDHAMQLLFLALVMARFGGSWRLPIALVSLFFCLPRLMSGAHWLSDVAVGGLGIAVLAFGFWFSRPVADIAVRPFAALWNALLRTSRPPAPAQQP